MAATSATRPAPPLQRDGAGGLLGGVCAGVARRFGLSPLLVRAVFMLAAAFGGFGVALYALAWIVLPPDPATPPGSFMRGRRASVEVALGTGLLLLSALLAFREAGLWLSDAVVWPLVLVASGAALLWRQSAGPPGAPAEAPVAATPPADVQPGEGRVALVSRAGLGVALVVAAGVVFLQATGALSAARDVVLAALVVAVVLGMIFAPLVTRLVRSLTAERRERIRSQERAEMAAHLHDSVLQTLALVQKRADNPGEVATLARRQERELRAWLSGRSSAGEASETLASALERAAEEVERERRVPVEVVVVGERPLDERVLAVVAAAREAILNAAKFGGGSPVDVYAEASADRLAVFVRDRGPGFDPGALPPDRRGVRESIVGRMERHGGHARIHSSPGGGTEVELVLEEP